MRIKGPGEPTPSRGSRPKEPSSARIARVSKEVSGVARPLIERNQPRQLVRKPTDPEVTAVARRHGLETKRGK